MKRQRHGSRLWPGAAFALAALIGPALAGPAVPPAVAPTAAQLHPPATRLKEANLVDGGYLRALDIVTEADGVRVRSALGWREYPQIRVAGEVRQRRAWLGTDHQGRSLLARAAQGARTSFLAAAVATTTALLLGTIIGLAAAILGRRPAGAARVLVDGLLGIPRLLLLLMVGMMFRSSPSSIGLAIGLVSWMEVARLVEAETRGLLARPFAAAARATGASAPRLAVGHVLPNLGPVLSVSAPLVATQAILVESTLSFLGVSGSGAASWGAMVADGQRLLPQAWWLVLFPGALLCLAALAVHGIARPVAPSSGGRPS